MPPIKCIKCGEELKRGNIAFLEVPPGIGGCKMCFIDVEASDLEIIMGEV